MPATSEPVGVLAEDGLRRLGQAAPLREYLQAIWGRRDFLMTVPMGQLRAQHQNTLLGSIWHLLNPMMLALVFYIVFGVLLPRVSAEVDNFVAFLVIGVLVFHYTSKALIAGSRTVVANIKLIQNINMPRAVLPMAAAVGETLAFVPALIALFVVVLATGQMPMVTWLLAVPVVAVQGVFNLGLAFFAARLTFHFRDTEQILPFFMRLWFYLSGIFFAASLVPEGLPRTIFQLNPMNVFIELMRGALLYGEVSQIRWLLALCYSASFLFLGFFFFRQAEVAYGRG